MVWMFGISFHLSSFSFLELVANRPLLGVPLLKRVKREESEYFQDDESLEEFIEESIEDSEESIEDSEEGPEDRVIRQDILNNTHCANKNLLKEKSKESASGRSWRRGGWWHAGPASSSTVFIECISQPYFSTVFLKCISQM